MAAELLGLIMILLGASSGAAKDVAKRVHDETQFGAEQIKLTKLHFFLHETASGKNPTVVTMAKSAISDTSRSSFGDLNMTEDPLTLGHSTTIGYARGLYGLDGRNQTELAMAVSLVFTGGSRHNGSTLALVGHNEAMESPREMPILGGTGAFRLARGVAVAREYLVSGVDAIVEYDVAILHY